MDAVTAPLRAPSNAPRSAARLTRLGRVVGRYLAPTALVLASLLPARASAPASVAAEAAAEVEATPPPAVTGYALGSLRGATLRRDAPHLTTVTVAGVGIDPTGRRVAAPGADVARVLARAQAAGLHAELLLSNYSDRIGDFDTRAADRLLTHPGRIRAVARQVAEHAVSLGVDGINVDLEALRPRDAPGLVELLRQLRSVLPDGALLTIDVSARGSADSYRAGGYDLAGIAATVDVVQLMTYDEHGPTWSGAGPIGSLDWQRRCLEAALRAVPAAQLDLGVAGYGYSWPRTGTGRSLSVHRAEALAARSGPGARWHAAIGEWSARLADGTRLWWSDARSYAARRDLAARYELHGLAIWRLGSADPLSGDAASPARLTRSAAG